MEALAARLADVGYERVSAGEYRCPWRSEPLTVRWQRAYWPDGMNTYDASVELVEGDVVRGSIDIDALLHQRIETPLREHIVEQIVSIAATLSGKRAHHR